MVKAQPGSLGRERRLRSCPEGGNRPSTPAGTGGAANVAQARRPRDTLLCSSMAPLVYLSSVPLVPLVPSLSGAGGSSGSSPTAPAVPRPISLDGQLWPPFKHKSILPSHPIQDGCAWLGSGLKSRLRVGRGRYLRRKRGVTLCGRQCFSGNKEECRNGGWHGDRVGSRDWRKGGKTPNSFEDPSKNHRSSIEVPS